MSTDLTEYVGSGPTVLMVTTPNCPYCQVVRASCESVGPEFDDVRFVELSAPDDPGIVSSLRIRSAPTLLAFSNGTELTRLNGSAGESDVRRLFAATRGEVEVRRFTVSTENRIIRIGSGLALVVAGLALGNLWLAAIGIPVVGLGIYDRLI